MAAVSFSLSFGAARSVLFLLSRCFGATVRGRAFSGSFFFFAKAATLALLVGCVAGGARGAASCVAAAFSRFLRSRFLGDFDVAAPSAAPCLAAVDPVPCLAGGWLLNLANFASPSSASCVSPDARARTTAAFSATTSPCDRAKPR